MSGFHRPGIGQTLLAQSAKHREVLVESHEGRARLGGGKANLIEREGIVRGAGKTESRLRETFFRRTREGKGAVLCCDAQPRPRGPGRMDDSYRQMCPYVGRSNQKKGDDLTAKAAADTQASPKPQDQRHCSYRITLPRMVWRLHSQHSPLHL